MYKRIEKDINVFNQNKIENNIELEVQDYSLKDSHNRNLNKCSSQKFFNLQYNNYKINNINIFQPTSNNDILTDDKDYINILVVDDEVLTRQSTKRVLQNISKSLKIKLDIIEADDGIETIFFVYKCITQGVKIS